MSTRPSRLNVTLDAELKSAVTTLARRRAIPVATLAADLIRDALERQEDQALSSLANRREQETSKVVAHDKVW